MKNKKGFTLVELLAVIAILGAIALITTPVIVGIITDSKESTNRVSATNYIRAVDTAIRTEVMDNSSIENGYYEIGEDGNICINGIKNGKCNGKKLKIGAKGNRPIKGNITIEDDEVARATVVFDKFTVELNYDGEIEYKPYTLKYEIGQLVKVILGTELPGANVSWYVIDENAETVTLLFSGVSIQSEWISSTDFATYKKTNDTCNYRNCSYIGPITIMNEINKTFTQVEGLEIDDYEYIHNSLPNNKHNYQKVVINDGKTIYTDYAGNKIILPEKTAARIMSVEEILKIASMYNVNLKYENLKEYIYGRLDEIKEILKHVFPTLETATTVEEVIEIIGMEDDWETVCFLVMALNQDFSDPEILKFVLPGWLSVQGKNVFTSTSNSLVLGTNAESHIFITIGLTLEDGTKVTGLSALPSTYEQYIQPVIQLRKDDKRIQ